MIDNIRLVEDQHERELRLVQDAACIQHIAHKRGRRSGARSVNNIANDSRIRGSNCIGDDATGSGPGEDFNLTRSINDNIAVSGVFKELKGRQEHIL